MNRLMLNMPGFLISGYVAKNFDQLTEEDFFKVAKKVKITKEDLSKNDGLLSSDKVLKHILEYTDIPFSIFSERAFSDENLDLIVEKKVPIQFSDVEKTPILLSKPEIAKTIINEMPLIIKTLPKDIMTPEIIEILENSNYTVDKEDLEKFPMLLENNSIMSKAVKKDSSIIVDLHKMTPQPSNFNYLVKEAFKNDPTMIVYFNENEVWKNAQIAVDNGYIATLEDFRLNPYLSTTPIIVESAISKDPNLILYAGRNWYLSDRLLTETLKKITITREHLENNPELVYNRYLMLHLPQFKLFSELFVTEQDKVDAIVDVFQNGMTISTENLPFFDVRFGSKVSLEKLLNLSQLLSVDIDHTNMDNQEKYSKILNKLVSSVAEERFIQNQSTFLYPSFVSLQDDMKSSFIAAKDITDLEQLIDKIYEFCDKKMDRGFIASEVCRDFESYRQNGLSAIEDAEDFCKSVTDQHRNNYISSEILKTTHEIFKKLELTPKRKNSFLDIIKVDKVGHMISNEKYEEIGITKEELDTKIEEIISKIIKGKDKDIRITDKLIDKWKSDFKLFGGLKKEDIYEDLLSRNRKFFINESEADKKLDAQSKYISNLFYRLKRGFIDKVELSEEEQNISFSSQQLDNLGMNYNNFIIANKNNYFASLAKLMVSLDEKTIDDILANGSLIEEIKDIIPFIDLIPELNSDSFIHFVSNYSRIREKIVSNSKGTIDDNSISSVIFDKIGVALKYSEAYNSVDDISLSLLGKKVVSCIDEVQIDNYSNFYVAMLQKESCTIPPITVETDKLRLESGRYSEPERLLIGVIPNGYSCVKLENSAGRETFIEILTGNDGDVIVVRDNNGEMISRIFEFRRGNTVQLVSNSYSGIVDMETYKQIADQIMNQSIQNGDNLEYVFVCNSSVSPNYSRDGYKIIEDERFSSKLPHVDSSSTAVLLSSKDSINEFTEGLVNINLDFDAQPNCSYNGVRKEISTSPSEEQITALRALNINLQLDPITKEEMKRDFEIFCWEQYDMAFCGQDWYIARKKDGTYEELILPIADTRCHDEIEQAKAYLSSLYSFEKPRKVG